MHLNGVLIERVTLAFYAVGETRQYNKLYLEKVVLSRPP